MSVPFESLGDAPVDASADACAPPAAHTKKTAFWLTDFLWSDGRLQIRKTGVRLKLDYYLFEEIACWAVWLVILWTAALIARLTRTRRRTLAYVPEQPRPWYLMRAAALWAGFDLTSDVARADGVFYFDDVTEGHPLAAAAHAPRFNFTCMDISKSHVARVFEEVFGYSLLVDPETTVGSIVEKSETNGVHDGRIVEAPLRPRTGYCYQRLIDTRGADGWCRDLRTPCVGGVPIVVWVKEKPGAERFAIHNRRARLRDPADVFSLEELSLIGLFTARMGLDWGGLDILRDQDGRIYIVDVNKTDLGPVIALSWGDKIRSMNRLSRALKPLVGGAA